MNYRPTLSSAAVFLTAGIFLAGWSKPGVADVACPPNLAAVTVNDNVVIAARCEMRGTTVKGNVRVFAGGSLLARNVVIDGNLHARVGFDMDVAESTVDGNVHLDDLVGDSVLFTGTRVDGHLRIRDNRVLLQLLDNDFRSDVEVSRNRGGVHLFGNAVRGKLECRGNQPAPVGGDNRVRGRSEGQCANLNDARPPRASDPPPAGGEAPPPAPADPVAPSAPPSAGGAGQMPPPAPTGDA